MSMSLSSVMNLNHLMDILGENPFLYFSMAAMNTSEVESVLTSLNVGS
jgi:hypothetical protein